MVTNNPVCQLVLNAQYRSRLHDKQIIILKYFDNFKCDALEISTNTRLTFGKEYFLHNFESIEKVDKNDNKQQFSTGAVRSNDANGVRYDLIPPIGLRQLAETYAEGAEKYGDNNWQKGLPIGDTLNHLIRHIELWRSGDRSEPHLAHAAFGLFTLIHFEERYKISDGEEYKELFEEYNNGGEHGK